MGRETDTRTETDYPNNVLRTVNAKKREGREGEREGKRGGKNVNESAGSASRPEERPVIN
jgi:hypothetical protein